MSRPRMGMSRWQHQWLRALRWYGRTSGAWQAASIDDVEDYVLATWQNVWHVCDYLDADPAVPTRDRSVASFALQVPALSLIRDLANVSKHAELTRTYSHAGLQVGGLGHAGWVDDNGRENPAVVWLYLRWDDTPNGPGSPALLPAYNALHAWRQLFRQWELPWDDHRPDLEWPDVAEPPSEQPRP